jgi:hypothetical protein
MPNGRTLGRHDANFYNPRALAGQAAPLNAWRSGYRRPRMAETSRSVRKRPHGDEIENLSDPSPLLRERSQPGRLRSLGQVRLGESGSPSTVSPLPTGRGAERPLRGPGLQRRSASITLRSSEMPLGAKLVAKNILASVDEALLTEGFLRRPFSNGAAQESNLPSVGLPRLTGLKVCYERSI